MDELGTGIRDTYKYNKIYSGADPIFTEGDVFRTIIPLSMQADEEIFRLLKYCKTPVKVLKHRTITCKMLSDMITLN